MDVYTSVFKSRQTNASLVRNTKSPNVVANGLLYQLLASAVAGPLPPISTGGSWRSPAFASCLASYEVMGIWTSFSPKEVKALLPAPRVVICGGNVTGERFSGNVWPKLRVAAAAIGGTLS